MIHKFALTFMQTRQHSIYLMAPTKGLMTPGDKKRKIFKGFEGNGDIILGLLSWGSNRLKTLVLLRSPIH